MGCQTEVELGANLTFSITTHDPDTGVLTDADSTPAYRVYEDETGTAILTGTMAKLDDASTTGFYSEQIGCTAANGFEFNKSYTIYIAATVDSDTGGICFAFRCYNPWSSSSRTLTQAAASVTAAVSGSDLSLHRGDTFSASLTDLGSIAARDNLWFTIKRTKDDVDTSAIIMIDTDTGLLYVNGAAGTAAQGSITVDDEDDGDISITIDEAVTATLAGVSDVFYDVQMLDTDGDVTTLTYGSCDITKDVTRAIA